MRFFQIPINLLKTLKNEHDGMEAFGINAKKLYQIEGCSGIIRAIFRTFKTVKRNVSPHLDEYDDEGGLLDKLANFKLSFSKKTVGRDKYFQQLFNQSQSLQEESIQISSSSIKLAEQDPKIIAFYLPQFHPFPENNLWWGKGFTEWTNVSKAIPQFIGHYQPRLPGELGFYDLRLEEVQKRQIELAKRYGIHGFCYHHYWFGGKRLLETPASRAINNKDMQFPFCLCWANENWTRRWDGAENEVLIAQKHSPEDDIAFIKDIMPALTSKHYIRINGKPLLIVYRVNLLPDAAATAERWRDFCKEAGLGEIFLIAAQAFGVSEPKKYGFDASVEFPPHKFYAPGLNHAVDIVNPNFKGRIFDYGYLAGNSKNIKEETYPLYRTVIPSWDNEARMPGRGHVFHNAKPASYQKWLTNTCRHVKSLPVNKENFVFVNAWNEWAEGAYLEPDRRYGYAYLQATGNAILTTRTLAEKEPLISVVVPAYNHEKYIYRALSSIGHQTYQRLEIIIINDGSTDNTEKEIKLFIENNPALNIIHTYQENAGTSQTIKTGVQKSSGTLIAILNSDDFYELHRFEVMLKAMRRNNSCFAFSDVCFIDDKGDNITDANQYINKIRRKLNNIGQLSNIIYDLLDSNIAVTSGNFLFPKWLYDTIGGFSDHKLVHDWDFILNASFITEPIFIPQKLYHYRIHQTNTYNQLNDIASRETDSVLSNFFARYKTNYALFNAPFSRKNFNQFIQQRGYDKYLR